MPQRGEPHHHSHPEIPTGRKRTEDSVRRHAGESHAQDIHRAHIVRTGKLTLMQLEQ